VESQFVERLKGLEALGLTITAIRVDEARVVAPISATMIRGNPRAFSEWIYPDVLRDVLKWDLSGL
jgi:hypothetical protein